jgi:hypothetical protein
MKVRLPLAPQVLIVSAFLLLPAAWPASSQTRSCGAGTPQTCTYRSEYEVCSAFSDPSCLPDFIDAFDEQLQLTIETRDRSSDAAAQQNETRAPEQLDNIRSVFAALLRCWAPPAKDVSRPGAQFSVRVSFKRNGEVLGKPRVTYVSPGLPQDVRQAYSQSVDAAIERCTPLPFSKELGGALAGRPFAVRFVDRRSRS